MQQQVGEERPLARAVDGDGTPVRDDLQRPENPKVGHVGPASLSDDRGMSFGAIRR